MIKKNYIIAVVLSFSLLFISCKENEDLAPLSIPVIFNMENSNGKVSLPDKVDLVANDIQNNDIIEAEIPVDQRGIGNIGGLATGNGWHVKFWTSDFGKNLSLDKNKGFKLLYQKGAFLPEAPVFFAGVTDFSYQAGKSVYWILKPQTCRLTFRLVTNDPEGTNSLLQGVSGVLSGVVSERVFGPKQIEISEENPGYIPLKFTSSLTIPYTFTASYRLLGISRKQKCEIQLDFLSDDFPPLTIDLTDKLQDFNNFSGDEMICTIRINSPSSPTEAEIEIEVEMEETIIVTWGDNGEYEQSI
jgi:hypothetical protein